MERSLFGFIIRYSKRDQLLIVPLVLATMLVYYLTLDLPKTIINKAIQGGGFPTPEAQADFLGLPLDRIEYLLALSLVFLGLIVLNGWLKFYMNTRRAGWAGACCAACATSCSTHPSLPLSFRRQGGRDGDHDRNGVSRRRLHRRGADPPASGGQAATAISSSCTILGARSIKRGAAVVAIQGRGDPQLRSAWLVLGRERQLTIALAGRIAGSWTARPVHANGTSTMSAPESRRARAHLQDPLRVHSASSSSSS
jgi:putative ABC transport system ATP-binding protein